MSLDINNIFNDNLSDDEITELLKYSADESTLMTRYIVACQIISNLSNEQQPDIVNHDEAVDLTICKMLLDGDVQVDEIDPILH